MKLIILVVPHESRDEIETILEGAGVSGYTEIPEVYGEGKTGPRFGSRAAPGTSAVVFTAVEDDRLPEVRRRVFAVTPRVDVRLFVVPLDSAS